MSDVQQHPGMTGAVAPPRVPVAATLPAQQAAEQRFLIRDLDWSRYRQIADALTDRHYHLSFDGRNLELMTTHLAHDWFSRCLFQMVVILTDELGMPRKSGGQFTMEREDLERAIEADETFYLANASKVRGKKTIDLAVDPPPELAIEIDTTTDSRRRLGIYATIGVLEIWRFDGHDLFILHRQADGNYAEATHSKYFPFVSGTDLARFLSQEGELEEDELLRAFRAWVRERISQTS